MLKLPEAGVPKMGEINVLFSKVSVVNLPTSVSVVVGNVNVPLLMIVEIFG